MSDSSKGTGNAVPGAYIPTDPAELANVITLSQDRLVRSRVDEAKRSAEAAHNQAGVLRAGLTRQAERMKEVHGNRSETFANSMKDVAGRIAALQPQEAFQAILDYSTDATQRAVLMMDAMRRRGDIFLEHEAQGCPPVLDYEYDIVLDGKDLPMPCNYLLMRIRAPEGVTTIEQKRPYIIIDPRAGHGPGIGGFKTDSQVGVALKGGHPVYFIGFRPQPEPGQTLASVTKAEAAFAREVMRLHPQSNKPIIIGNCQGGWATALLAATNPDIAGPIVLNGAPMSYWSGQVGENPMRYNGGLLGGITPALLLSDMTEGRFDGAWLVQNFEALNPSRMYFRQYYDLFRDIDRGTDRFLQFQRWWGGFYWMNEDEIRWIVENLFVGNRLARGEAALETGRAINVKKITAPIIVFASYGDNITPPQQALNWIVDAYASEEEIKICGQRIVYMLHDKVGHLGIFVSGAVAKREHSEIASTLATIETLAPGLYEMKIEDIAGEGQNQTFTVSFHRRTLDDLATIDDGRDEEAAFAAVSRASELGAEMYDVMARPVVKAMSSEAGTAMAKAMHPMRLQRSIFASSMPWMAAVPQMADMVKAQRKLVTKDNPLVQAETLWADAVEQSMDLYRDMRDMMYEATFFSIWQSPMMQMFGQSRAKPRAKKDADELRLLPDVHNALLKINLGGYAEAVVRMLILLAGTRSAVRRDRLERSAHVLSKEAPFDTITPDLRAHIIQEQSICAQFDPEAAVAALPRMIPTRDLREKAIGQIEYVLGSVQEMEPTTIETLQKFRQILELEPLATAAE